MRVLRATRAEKTCKDVDPNAQSYNYWTRSPRKSLHEREREREARPPHTQNTHTHTYTEHTHTHTHPRASGPPPGDEEGESEREGVRAFHMTPIGAAGNGLEPSLYAGSGAFLAEGSAVSGLGLGGRCKVNPTTL